MSEDTNKTSEELTLRQRFDRAKTVLQFQMPFFGYIAANFRLRKAEPRHNVPTMGVTPDFYLFVNEEFAATLSPQEFAGVIVHEVLHPAMLFWVRKGTRDQTLFNIAHDYEINHIIVDYINLKAYRRESLELPEGTLVNDAYRGMTAEEIYDLLEKEIKANCGGKGKSGCDGEGDGAPSNSWGVGDIRMDLAQTEEGRAAGNGDETAIDSLKAKSNGLMLAAAETERSQSSDGQGSLPGAVEKYLKNLLESKVDWRDLLSQFLGENAGGNLSTYARPSRRQTFGGERLIGRRKAGYPEVTVLWDTSGSMSGEEEKILTEVHALCEGLGLRLRVMIVDAALHNDFLNVENIDEIIEGIKGGGGSDFNPAFDRLEEESNDSVVLAFTDGYISVPDTMPQTLKDTVWVLTTSGQDPTDGSWGKVLKLDGKHGSWE